MFRIQDNVPEVYIQQSRDFQLVSRLYDLLFSGVKYDIDSMVNVLDATLTRDNLLHLMCSKIGFFPRIQIDANILKYIIASFPYIIKHKGSRLGIEYAVNAVLKSETNPSVVGKIVVNPINKFEAALGLEYTVCIYTSISVANKQALNEVMRYVLPIGCDYMIVPYNNALSEHGQSTTILNNHGINVIKLSNKLLGNIKGTTVDEYLTNYEYPLGVSKSIVEDFVGSVKSSTILGSGVSVNDTIPDVVKVCEFPTNDGNVDNS